MRKSDIAGAVGLISGAIGLIFSFVLDSFKKAGMYPHYDLREGNCFVGYTAETQAKIDYWESFPDVLVWLPAIIGLTVLVACLVYAIAKSVKEG